MTKRKCKQCGKEFTLSDSEIKFYEDKNLELPKRCNECRKKNKNQNINNNDNKIENNHENVNINKKNVKMGKGKLIRNVIIAMLIAIFPFLGKVYNFINENDTWLNSVLNNEQSISSLTFRNDQLWEDHFEKHKDEFTYTTKEQYLQGANKIVAAKDSLHKKEEEDGDSIYYSQSKNEIVFVSEDGYIRTYFKPNDGIEYFNRQ